MPHPGPEPWATESNWLSLAIAGAVLLAVGIAAAAFWIFAETDQVARLVRVNIVAPFGVVGIAAITFATVVWRGLISARQADTTLRQLEGLHRQIALTEETNLATLLQKGAEFLADENDAKVAAGIASIRAVAEAPTQSFNEPARRLLVDFIRRKGANAHSSPRVKEAIRALRAAWEKTKLKIAGYMVFEEDDELAARYDDYKTDWQLVFGTQSVLYVGGDFSEARLHTVPDATQFRRVRFWSCSFDDLAALDLFKCTFIECSFKEVSTDVMLEHTFRRCDFSDTRIGVLAEMPDLRSEGNYFLRATPPHGQDMEWAQYLEALDERPDLPF